MLHDIIKVLYLIAGAGMMIMYAQSFVRWNDTPQWWIPSVGIAVGITALRVLYDLARERVDAMMRGNSPWWPSFTVTAQTGIHARTLKKWAEDGLVAKEQRNLVGPPHYRYDDVLLTVAEKILTGEWTKPLWCKMPIATLERAAEKLRLSLVDLNVKRNMTACLPFNFPGEHDNEG